MAQDEITIHEHKRLRGRCRGRPAVAVDGHRGEVERRQQGDWFRASGLKVEAAARGVIVGQDMADGVLGHRHGGAVKRAPEATAQGENDVPDLLGLQPPEREVAVKSIARIGRRGCLAAARRLAVNRGGHDQLVHTLERPALAHQFVGEPVEQFRMGRPGAQHAEVARCIDESAADSD